MLLGVRNLRNFTQQLEPKGEKVSVSVDASHQIWHDMRGHTEIAIGTGGAIVYARSLRQKIRSVSSTETEIVAVSQMFSEPLWFMQFLEDLPPSSV